MKASGNTGSGLIKTINSANPNFCLEKECVYYLTVVAINIKELSLFPSKFDNGSVITIKRNVHLVEELEPNE